MSATALAWVGLLACSGLDVDGSAQVTLTQRAGEIPTGSSSGDSRLGFDSELAGTLTLSMDAGRDQYALGYGPRFLFRVQDLPQPDQPNRRSLQALEANGRPFVMSHSFNGTSSHSLSARWSLSNALTAMVGEQDFATFAAGGLGTGGSSGTLVQTPVIEIATVGLSSTIRGPLIGRNDFTISGSLALSLPSGEGVGSLSDGDGLCFAEPSNEDPSAAVGALARSCALGLTVGTVHPLSASDELTFTFSYTSEDLDPGIQFHSLSLGVSLSHEFTRFTSGSIAAGLTGSIATATSTSAGLTGDVWLPSLQANLTSNLVDERMLQVGVSFGLSGSGAVDPINQRFLLRTAASANGNVTVSQQHIFALGLAGFLVGPELGCPPRQGGAEIRLEGCPDDLTPAERDAEIPDLSGVLATATYTWSPDPGFSLSGGAQYALRGPHISRWADPPATGTANREITGLVTLSLSYNTGRP